MKTPNVKRTVAITQTIRIPFFMTIPGKDRRPELYLAPLVMVDLSVAFFNHFE